MSMRVEQQLQAERDVVERLTSQANTYALQLALMKGRRPVTGKLRLKLDLTEAALARHKLVAAGLEVALAPAGVA